MPSKKLLAIFSKYLLSVSLIVVGIIHLIPITGAAGIERLDSLYGVGIGDSNLSILMRHRAVLFGLLGSFLMYAAFKPPLQLIALIGGTASVGSFLFLALATGALNEKLERVFVADVVAAVFLILGVVAYIGIRFRR